MPLPNVIHAGFAKCGSTFLQAFLRQHPQVNFRFKAEFFSPLDDCSYVRGPDYYAGRFDSSKPGQVVVESDEHLLMPLLHPTLAVRSVTNDSIDAVCERLNQTVPEAKILVVIRNQLDMMVSTYSQYLLGGGTLDMERFALEFLQCSLTQRNYFEFHYDEILRILYRHFPDRLKIVLAEEMASDTAARLDEICRFMGIPYTEFRGSFRDRRIGLSNFGMNFVRHFNWLVARRNVMRYNPEQWMPLPLYKAICNAARVMEHYALRPFVKSQRVQLASPRLIETIHNTFCESNERLSLMLDKDLSRWPYFTRGDVKRATVYRPVTVSSAKTAST